MYAIPVARHAFIGNNTAFQIELQMAPDICIAFDIRRLGRPDSQFLESGMS